MKFKTMKTHNRPDDIGIKVSKGRMHVKDKNDRLEWIKSKHESFKRQIKKRKDNAGKYLSFKSNFDSFLDNRSEMI